MKQEYVYYDFVDVYDDKVFTKERADEWKDYIVQSYKIVYDDMKSMLDNSSPIRFWVNKSLLEETIIDAIIGMRKIVDSSNNSVEDPNSFKIAAYLSYWWLRHKPANIHYPTDYDIRDVKLVRNEDETDSQYDERCRKFVWQLKHINELVAVQMVVHYIFDIDDVICDNRRCKYIKKKNDGKFCFDTFDDMYEAILKKLTYYFSYRAIAPKIIEHLLEAYTFHPAWGLTGAHWSGDLESDGDDC